MIMGGNKSQLSFSLGLLLFIGFTASVLAQGRGRLVRVRKTGEFGRRITPISTSYQPPPRDTTGNDPYFETAETRRSGSNNVVFGIKKPSQSLQLPIYTPPDQEAEESGENVQGYAYPDPNSPAPTDYNKNNQKPPILEFPQQEVDEPGQNLDEAPVPVQPEREAELPPRGNRPVPLAAEAEELIGAEELGAPRKAPPAPVRDSPSAETGTNDCPENDHSCWPGGYKSEIPGDAGTDYPILSEIVDTSFDCDSVQYSGYYADTDESSRCQMFHVCLKGNAFRRTQKWSFLCPNGTVFSQNDFVCVWWNAAPECTSSVVSELSLRNEELGWDNLTEADQLRAAGGGFDVNSAMSSLANTNLQPSSSNSRLKNTLPDGETNRRRSGQRVRQGNGNPYRVPVKVSTGSGARTKLKEVSHNSLQQGPDNGNSDLYGGVEHFGEESETFETSLRHQSEARRKTKSGSALAKSESEAYEQKSVSDSVSPFIVTRGNPPTPTGNSNEDYSDEHEGTSSPSGGVVMMASQQRNPDGSEGIAQVPVRIQEEGYRYPNPTSTPGPAYLPPRKDYTTETPTSTFIPGETSDAQAQGGGYDYQTPEYSQQLLQEQPEDSISTTEESGYRYPTPTTTEKAGYNYEAPSTTTEQSLAEYNNNVEDTSEGTTEGGYNNNNGNYDTPSTTEQEGYRYPQPSTTTEQTSSAGVTEEEYSINSKPVFEDDRMNAGYAYEPSTTTSRDITTTTLRTTEDPEFAVGSLEATTIGSGGYLPPSKEGGYSASQVHQSDPEVLALPNEGDDKDALGGSEEVSNSSGEELSTDGPTTGISGGYSTGGSKEEETTQNNNNIPTPLSTLPGGSHLDSPPAAAAAPAPEEGKGVNDILEQIKAGGAEVRDENGNKIDFDQLQKLILSTPNGQLALQKADDSITTASSSAGDTATSEVTEVAPTGESGDEVNTEIPSGGYEESAPAKSSPAAVSASPTLETVQPIQDYVVNNQNSVPTTIQQGYSSPAQPQESYFTNNRLVSSKHGNFEISAPSKEYENHSVEQNSIDNPTSPLLSSGGVRNSFETGFPSSSSYESQRIPNQIQPQGLINSPFVSSQQGGFVSSVSPSVPQPEQYYTQAVSSQTKNNNGYFQQQQQQQSSFQSSIPTQQSQQYFQEQTPSYFNSPNQYLPPSPVNPARSNPLQLQQSYNVPIPQASSINRKLVGPSDIKIVPALFVHQHTRVENPDGSPVASSSNNNFQKTSNAYPQQQQERFNGHYNIQSSRSAYIPYASQNIPVRVKAPRLNGFTRRDVLNAPKNVESFTPDDARIETRKYHGNLPSSAQSSIRRRRRRTSKGSRTSGLRGQLDEAEVLGSSQQ